MGFQKGGGSGELKKETGKMGAIYSMLKLGVKVLATCIHPSAVFCSSRTAFSIIFQSFPLFLESIMFIIVCFP